MGPRHEGRGEHLPSRGNYQGPRASMGPRHEGRGERVFTVDRLLSRPSLQWGHGTKAVENLLVAAARPRAAGASMGPRHEGRGEPVEDLDVGEKTKKLQWGHGTKAVENTRSGSA